MGFAATGDSFCFRGDMELQGMLNCVKVVDDVLLYHKDYLTRLKRINEMLFRCRIHNITLTVEKFVVSRPAVSFCGSRLS